MHPPPLQPTKVEPAAGAAVRVTTALRPKLALQVVPQAMPDALLTTVPVPVPVFVIDSMLVVGRSEKLAVTVVSAPNVTVHVDVPLQPPPFHPIKTEPWAAVAVSVTALPVANGAAQVVPQLMPDGLVVTTPAPVPAFETASTLAGMKVAVTAALAVPDTVQVNVPLQAPPQLTKTDPGFAVAISVTLVPKVNPALQVAPQVMPAGALVTVPAPVPDFATDSV